VNRFDAVQRTLSLERTSFTDANLSKPVQRVRCGAQRLWHSPDAIFMACSCTVTAVCRSPGRNQDKMSYNAGLTRESGAACKSRRPRAQTLVDECIQLFLLLQQPPKTLQLRMHVLETNNSMTVRKSDVTSGDTHQQARLLARLGQDGKNNLS